VVAVARLKATMEETDSPEQSVAIQQYRLGRFRLVLVVAVVVVLACIAETMALVVLVALLRAAP
jgi:hypothetical protein